MPTATARPTAATRTRELPRLRHDAVPPTLDTTSGFEEAVKLWRELFADARHKRTAADQAERQIEMAMAADAEDAAERLVAGGEPSTTTTESTAIEDAEVKYRDALAATIAANKTHAQICKLIKGDAGVRFLASTQQRIKAARLAMHKRLDQVEGDLGELGALMGLADWVKQSQTFHRDGLPAINRDATGKLYVQGAPVDAGLLLEHLRTIGEPDDVEGAA